MFLPQDLRPPTREGYVASCQSQVLKDELDDINDAETNILKILLQILTEGNMPEVKKGTRIFLRRDNKSPEIHL